LRVAGLAGGFTKLTPAASSTRATAELAAIVVRVEMVVIA
jgi:hypothetical protein